ncbi:MAG: carbohydrate kinase family protein [Desulfurococcaceae archaeon]
MISENTRNSSKELHPYVVLLPTSIDDKIKYITTLFSTPVTIEILRLFEWNIELCQKDIIMRLSQHSNKTIIGSIKKLVSLNLLEEIEKEEYRGNRKVRVKCYKLTDVGKWYNILFKDISELSNNLIKEAVTNLSVMFMAKILPFSEHLKIGFTEFVNHVMSSAIKSAARSKKHSEYDLLVFGSLALDVYLKPSIMITSGGAGANVAALASNLGLKTGFVSRVPANVIGSYLLAELINEGVDVSLVELDQDLELPVCIILEPLEPTQIQCTCNPRADFKSLPVTYQINDEVVQASAVSRSIYLGEGICKTYLDLLGKIKLKDKILVFRPHKISLEYYFEECLPILNYSPILILNEEKEQILLRKGINVPGDLFKAGVEEVIVTKGSRGVVLYINGRDPRTYTPPKVNAVNTVGAGDAFSASLIYYLLKYFNIEEAVKKAVYLSAVSTTQLTSRKHLAEAKYVK